MHNLDTSFLRGSKVFRLVIELPSYHVLAEYSHFLPVLTKSSQLLMLNYNVMRVLLLL